MLDNSNTIIEALRTELRELNKTTVYYAGICLYLENEVKFCGCEKQKAALQNLLDINSVLMDKAHDAAVSKHDEIHNEKMIELGFFKRNNN